MKKYWVRYFYRGRYALALYDWRTDDELFDVVDNVNDLARKYNLKISTVWSTLTRIWNGERISVKINHRMYRVHFIDMFEDDDYET